MLGLHTLYFAIWAFLSIKYNRDYNTKYKTNYNTIFKIICVNLHCKNILVIYEYVYHKYISFYF